MKNTFYIKFFQHIFFSKIQNFKINKYIHYIYILIKKKKKKIFYIKMLKSNKVIFDDFDLETI